MWMVHALTGQNGVKGALSMEERGLVFRPAMGRGAEEVFLFDQITKVSRSWGSPVMQVKLRIPQGLPVVGFYFIRPPSLEAPEGTRFNFKGRGRRRAAAQLYKGNAERKGDVVAWVQAIREVMGR